MNMEKKDGTDAEIKWVTVSVPKGLVGPLGNFCRQLTTDRDAYHVMVARCDPKKDKIVAQNVKDVFNEKTWSDVVIGSDLHHIVKGLTEALDREVG